MENLDSRVDLWVLLTKVHHFISLARSRELKQYHIAPRQTFVLRTIEDLGSKATIMEIARIVDREDHVISRQAVKLENDKLIKRIKKTPKSNLLNLKLTKKGLDIAKISRQSESIENIFLNLSEEECQQLKLILNKILNSSKKESTS